MTFCPDEEIGPTSASATHWETEYAKNVTGDPNPALDRAVWFSVACRNKPSRLIGAFVVHQDDRGQVMHVMVNGDTAVLRCRGHETRARRAHHAGKADLAAAARRPRLRPFDLPAGLLRAVRRRADRLSRPSRQRAQRGRSARELDLAQWGDDVRAFCDALGIADPVVLGASFGGMVAMSYATRHPDHPVKAGADQHRSGRRFLSGTARGAVRAVRRCGSRRAGTTPVPGGRAAIRIRPRSKHGGGWQCRSTRACRATRIRRGAR